MPAGTDESKLLGNTSLITGLSGAMGFVKPLRVALTRVSFVGGDVKSGGIELGLESSV